MPIPSKPVTKSNKKLGVSPSCGVNVVTVREIVAAFGTVFLFLRAIQGQVDLT